MVFLLQIYEWLKILYGENRFRSYLVVRKDHHVSQSQLIR